MICFLFQWLLLTFIRWKKGYLLLSSDNEQKQTSLVTLLKVDIGYQKLSKTDNIWHEDNFSENCLLLIITTANSLSIT